MKKITPQVLLLLFVVFSFSCENPTDGGSNMNQSNTPDPPKQGATFTLTTDCDTPEGEIVALRYYLEWPGLYEMTKTGENTWEVTIDMKNQHDLDFKYRYCRQFQSDGAEESFDSKNKSGWRLIKLPPGTFQQEDTVKKWRWWPKDGNIPKIDTAGYMDTKPSNLPRKDFATGIWLPDYWWDWFKHSVKLAIDKIKDNAQAEWVQYSPEYSGSVLES